MTNDIRQTNPAGYQELLSRARIKYQVPSASEIPELRTFLLSIGFEKFELSPFRTALIDEFVDESHLVLCMSMVNPEWLASMATPAERENVSEYLTDPWDTNEYPGSKDWTLLSDELSRFSRVIILVERSKEFPNLVGNFKVYGQAQVFRESVWAATGCIPRDVGYPLENAELFREAFKFFDLAPFQSRPLNQNREDTT